MININNGNTNNTSNGPARRGPATESTLEVETETGQNRGRSGSKPIEFHQIFGENYGIYGLHVVQERALPDARDGLKPVQRRILYTLWEGRYLSSGPHRKSAEIVGKVLGDRHPHGDSSVYDAMSRMAQSFSLRYPLIDGQGNWGASDGSPAAAYRYTEARLRPLAEAMLSDDLKKETVPLLVTYKEDPRVVEPMYLPGHVPPCVNPIEGIAVGISTAVPPHNLGEALRACIAMLDGGVLDGKGFTTEQLMAYLPGPDFPEGGRLMITSGGVREYLETGKGRFTVRAEIGLEQLTPTRKALVITALPPVGRDKVITSIIDAINERKPGTEGLVAEPPLDETNEIRTRIVLELKRDAKAAQVVESLYRYTLLEIGVSAQLYFLFATKAHSAASHPRQVGVVELLSYWLHHQLDVLERRLTYELAGYRSRLRTVEALIIGARHAEPLVKIFQEAEGKAAAKVTIAAKYKLSEEQAEVIASMSLSQVTKPDAGKYQTEREELLNKIGGHAELLASRPRRIALLKSELKDTEKKFGDVRRTVIDRATSAAPDAASGGATATDSSNSSSSGGGSNVSLGLALTGPASAALPSTSVLNSAPGQGPLAIALYADGTVKATPLEQFSPKAKPVKNDESLTHLVAVRPNEFGLLATNRGRVFGLQTSSLEVTTRAAKGESLLRHLKLDRGERVVNLLSVPAAAFDGGESGGVTKGDQLSSPSSLYLVEFSALGKMKKTPVSEYKTAGSAGVSSLKLAENDEVVAALLSNGRGEYLLTTTNGQTLRFGDDKISAQGRVGQGQLAIALTPGAKAKVVGAEFWSGQGLSQEPNVNNGNKAEEETNTAFLLVLTTKGTIKKTALAEFPAKGRATSGVVTTLLASDDSIIATSLIRGAQANIIHLISSGQGGNLAVNPTSVPTLARAKKGQIFSFSGTGNQVSPVRFVPLGLLPNP